MMISLLIIVVSCHFTIFPPLLQSNGYKLYPHVSWNYQWIHCFFQEKNAPNCPFVSGVNSTWTKYQHPANEDLKKLTKCSVSQECRTSHVDHARSSPNINGLSSIYRKSWFFAITFCYPANLPLYKKKLWLGSLVPAPPSANASHSPPARIPLHEQRPRVGGAEPFNCTSWLIGCPTMGCHNPNFGLQFFLGLFSRFFLNNFLFFGVWWFSLVFAAFCS